MDGQILMGLLMGEVSGHQALLRQAVDDRALIIVRRVLVGGCGVGHRGRGCEYGEGGLSESERSESDVPGSEPEEAVMKRPLLRSARFAAYKLEAALALLPRMPF